MENFEVHFLVSLLALNGVEVDRLGIIVSDGNGYWLVCSRRVLDENSDKEFR